MMAALEAAGFDPVPAGVEPSAFRAQVTKDLAGLDPDLRSRLRTFYERNKLPAPATAADQAARYVSLAFALGPPPLLEAPQRSEELPGMGWSSVCTRTSASTCRGSPATR